MVTGTSDKETQVFQQLQQINERAAAMYLGAIMTLRTDSGTTVKDEIEIGTTQDQLANPEKLPQAAHSIREALNKILREIDIPEQKEKQRERIRKFADRTTKLPESFYNIHDKLFELHNWFVNIAHHGDVSNEIEFNQKLDQFSSIILQILTPHYEAEDEIDRLLSITKPTSKDLEELLGKITNYAIYVYIFHNIGAQWLTLLSTKEYIFKNPPLPEITNGREVHPTWPESAYLLSICQEKPVEVFDIISNCTVTNIGKNYNHRVLVDFVRVALTLPCKYSKRIAERIIGEKWSTPYPSSLDEEISNLIKKNLDECNDVLLSTKLARLLLDVDLAETKTASGIRERRLVATAGQQYGQLLEEIVPQIARKDPVVLTQVLTELLRKSIYLDGKARGICYQNDDRSRFWCLAIEEHLNTLSAIEIKSLLTISVRNVLQIAAEKDINLLKRSLDILSKESYPIFKRLQFFMYKDHFSKFEIEIEQSVVDYFGDIKYRHEYNLLLQSTYSYLNAMTKSRLLELIENGPDMDSLQSFEKETEQYKKRWKVDRLEPIIKHVPEKKEEYDQLVGEVGNSQLSNIGAVRSGSFQVNEPTELTEQMTVDEVLTFVNEYSLKEGFFPDDDGTVRKFGELVSSSPKEYSAQSTKLLPSHPIFYSEFFHALATGVQEDNQISWNAILELSIWILNTIEIDSNSTQESILRHMAELIRGGLLNRTNSIPFTRRRQVWAVLETIVDKCHGDGNWGGNYPVGNIGAEMISINTHTGQAIHALLQYSVWCYHKLRNEGNANTRLVPEVQALLELRLDPTNDSSISTHAVFGSHFHNWLALDKAWTCKNISKIFLRGRNSILGDAAWEALIFQQAYIEVFVKLKDEYEYRIKELQTETEIQGTRDPRIRLAQQMGLYYISGIQNSEHLFDLFLKHSPDFLIGECIKHIGWILKNQSEKNSVAAVCLRKLWDKSTILKRPEHGWLFAFSPLDKEWNIRQLHKCLDITSEKVEPLWEIFDQLAKYSKHFPLETIYCVEKIVNSNNNNPDFLLYQSDLENIFRDVGSSNDSSAIRIMKNTLDTLGKAGFEQFRKFA